MRVPHFSFGIGFCVIENGRECERCGGLILFREISPGILLALVIALGHVDLRPVVSAGTLMYMNSSASGVLKITVKLQSAIPSSTAAQIFRSIRRRRNFRGVGHQAALRQEIVVATAELRALDQPTAGHARVSGLINRIVVHDLLADLMASVRHLISHLHVLLVDQQIGGGDVLQFPSELERRVLVPETGMGLEPQTTQREIRAEARPRSISRPNDLLVGAENPDHGASRELIRAAAQLEQRKVPLRGDGELTSQFMSNIEF